jgi:hypothetical protein
MLTSDNREFEQVTKTDFDMTIGDLLGLPIEPVRNEERSRPIRSS